MKTNFQSLHEKALKTAQNYLKAESDLIAILQEIDDCRAYRELGFKSLFEYATQGLKLSESVSYNLITIARKSREVPQLQAMIQRQEITVSNARMVASVLTPENQERWLPVAATSSKRELEKKIAKEFPETKVQESARYVSEKRIELKLGISEELQEMLKRTQDLVSTQMGEAANFEKTLKTVLEFYIEKNDPLKKAERAEKRRSLKVESSNSNKSADHTARLPPVPGQVSNKRNETSNPSNLRMIPAGLRHVIRLRDKNQCTHRSVDGQRCPEKRWLDFHHLKSVSHGGQTTLDNLTLLCRGHHQLTHH